MIAVTLKQWNDLREHADRMALALERVTGNPDDPDWMSMAIDAFETYYAYLGR